MLLTLKRKGIILYIKYTSYSVIGRKNFEALTLTMKESTNEGKHQTTYFNIRNSLLW